MKFLTIDKIKQQLRLDCTCEAELLTGYGNSAERTLAAYLGYMDEKNHPSVDKMLEDFDGQIPEPLEQAALMLVDTWYQYRTPDSAQNMSVVPYTFDFIVKPYVKL
jgi:hypothetical protein